MPACCLSPLRAVMKSCTLTGSSMEQGHAPALPMVRAQVLLLLYVTPPVRYSSCSRPAGDVVWIQQCLAQLFQQRQHFYMGLATIQTGNLRKNQVLQEVVWVI